MRNEDFQLLIGFFPLTGIARRFQGKVAEIQQGSYDSRGMIEGSSLGSSPKVIAGSYEPIPMSC